MSEGLRQDASCSLFYSKCISREICKHGNMNAGNVNRMKGETKYTLLIVDHQAIISQKCDDAGNIFEELYKYNN